MYVNRKKRSVKWVHEGEGILFFVFCISIISYFLYFVLICSKWLLCVTIVYRVRSAHTFQTFHEKENSYYFANSNERSVIETTKWRLQEFIRKQKYVFPFPKNENCGDDFPPKFYSCLCVNWLDTTCLPTVLKCHKLQLSIENNVMKIDFAFDWFIEKALVLNCGCRFFLASNEKPNFAFYIEEEKELCDFDRKTESTKNVTFTRSKSEWRCISIAENIQQWAIVLINASLRNETATKVGHGPARHCTRCAQSGYHLWP